MANIIRFDYAGEPDAGAVETDVALAIFAAECIYGKPRTRLEASYLVADSGKTCVLRAAGEAGEAAARILTGLTSARVGEVAFTVRRLEDREAR